MNNLAVDTSLPRGVSDYVGDDSQYVDYIERQFLDTAVKWGYSIVRPAMFEYEDSLLVGVDQTLRSKMFRIDDWQTGRMLALPPDITPQVARISATRLRKSPYPHRLSYVGRVLRHTETLSGIQREMLQVGAELIGDASLMADVEVITIALQTLQQLGVTSLTMNLGHPMFAKGIFDALGFHGEVLSRVKCAVARKDGATIREIIKEYKLSDTEAFLLVELPRFFGGLDVLSEIKKQLLPEVCLSALQDVEHIAHALGALGIAVDITLDLGDTRGLGYHSGVTFEGYCASSTSPLFSGGRYDTLVRQYGQDAPATGVTCNTGLIAEVLKKQGIGLSRNNKAIVIWGNPLDGSELLQMVNQLQRENYIVDINRSADRLSDVLAYASIKKIHKVLTISGEVLTLRDLQNDTIVKCGYDTYQRELDSI